MKPGVRSKTWIFLSPVHTTMPGPPASIQKVRSDNWSVAAGFGCRVSHSRTYQEDQKILEILTVLSQEAVATIFKSGKTLIDLQESVKTKRAKVPYGFIVLPDCLSVGTLSWIPHFDNIIRTSRKYSDTILLSTKLERAYCKVRERFFHIEN